MRLGTPLALMLACFSCNNVFAEPILGPTQFPPAQIYDPELYRSLTLPFEDDRSVGSIILINQFGDGSGSDLTGSATACQDFETKYDEYDIAVVDNFSVQSSCKINQIIWGLNVFANCDPSLITGFRINIHDSLASAQTNSSSC